jgi:DNA-binding GntR family transcriptional regulator
MAEDDAHASVGAIHDQVRRWILDGELKAGTALSQVQLARRLSVGRTPLREALRMLQHEGLVEGEYNRRVRVAPFSLDDLEELYALRVVQETLAIRLTVPRFGEQDLERLASLLEVMHRHENEDFELWEAAHQSFHRLLVVHAGRRVVASLEQLADHTSRYRRALLAAAPISYAIGAREHRSIVDACVASDAELSGELLARHLARTAISLSTLLRPEHDPVTVREALRTVIADARPREAFVEGGRVRRTRHEPPAPSTAP